MSQLNPPEPPQNFAVSVRRGQLALSATWDTAEGATSYKLRWRKAGEEFTAANSATVSDTSAAITVSGYGQWEVRLQACNDNGCAPVDGGSEDETPAVRLSIEPAQDVASQAQPRARSATATRDPAADENSYTAGWGPAGEDSQAQSQSQQEADRQTRGIDGPSGAAVPMSSDQTDTTPPRLVRGEIDGDTMTFYFSEALDESATGSRFRVTLYIPYGWVNFTAHPSRVEVNGNKVTVHGLSRDGWPGYERAVVGRPVQAYYYKNDQTVPAGQRLRDLAGNEVLTPHRSPGGHFPVTRTIWVRNLTRPPALQSATANLNQLVLTFNKTLDSNSVPSASAFTVTVNGSAVSLAATDPVGVSGATVTLILASPVASTDAVAVGYTKPSERPLRGLDGAVDSFASGTNLVGVAPLVSQVELTSNAGTDLTYAKGEVIRVSLSVSETVNVTGSPRLKLDFRTGDGDEQWASYESGSGSTTLVFAYTAAAGDDSQNGVAVVANSLELNGGTIVSSTDGDNALLAHTGLVSNSNHRVDTTPPALARGVVNGTTLTLTFNEDLGAAASLSNAQFSVVRTPQGGTEESINLTGAPAISGGLGHADPGERDPGHRYQREGELHQADDGPEQQADRRRRQRGGELLLCTESGWSSAYGVQRGSDVRRGRGPDLRLRREYPGDTDIQRRGGRDHHRRHAAPQDQTGPGDGENGGPTTPRAAARRSWCSRTRWRSRTAPPRASPYCKIRWSSTAARSAPKPRRRTRAC